MSATADHESAALVASAVAGDEYAFARIVALHHDDLFRVAYAITGRAELASEAVQATWVIAWRKLANVRDPAHVRGWLVAVAANEARGSLRQRRTRSVRETDVQALDGTGADRDRSLDERDRGVDLMNALLKLAPHDRGIVAMRHVLGLSSTEIGRATGMSATGVRSRLARALRQLREDLGDA